MKMRFASWLLLCLLAGCLDSTGDSAAEDLRADAAMPVSETWYMTSRETDSGRVPVLAQVRPPESELQGGVGYTLNYTYGPYEAQVASSGFSTGAPVKGFLSYTCQNPTQMEFTMRIFSDGELVSTLEHEENFVGTALLFYFVNHVELTGVLAADIPRGSIVSATLQVNGTCSFFMLGAGGEYARGFTLG